MADRFADVAPMFDRLLTKLADTDITDMSAMSYERIAKHTAIEGTSGDVRTMSHTGDITDRVEHETLPQTVTGSAKFMDSRQETTHTNGQTDTDTFTPNTQGVESYNESRDINARTFSEMIRHYPRLDRSFIDEFDEFFIGVIA